MGLYSMCCSSFLCAHPPLMLCPHALPAKKKSGTHLRSSTRGPTCVAMPTGHVLVWHLRIMIQPSVMRGAVANPNSSAPSSAATVMSRPVRICPSACSVVRPRRSFATRVWWVSARPNSQGRPACLMDVHLAAPGCSFAHKVTGSQSPTQRL
jgi:hypothetical protein